MHAQGELRHDPSLPETEYPEEKPLGLHCSYQDCLCDHAPIPHQGNAEALFQVLMCAAMVGTMTTINGLRNTGLEFLADSLWLYPLVFCISLTLRITFAGKVVGFLRRRFVEGRFHEAAHGVVMTVLNTVVTSPIMCAIVTMLLVGPDDFWARYLSTLPITAPLSMVVSYLFVGPAVKMYFNNRISPVESVNMLERISENGAPIARLMGMS